MYETKDKKDRGYGAGSRLLETTDATFSYDEEGNLIQKVEKKSGATWQYEYTGNGMLAKVIKPDSTVVTFKYDALGRRVEKHSNEKTTTFIWDGNTIFHEYFSVDDSEKSENVSENSPQSTSERPANLITWVFNDGFVPSAKLTSEGNYSIISDYLGTPVEAYDEQGKKVWSAELDIYGHVQEFTGEQDFIPFRYQGQYEDVEIGLYYNRFRYYDPAQGNYTQVDPIGLAGGNPTLYGYVGNPNKLLDIFGLMPLANPVKQGHHMVPHALATYLSILPFNSQTGVPALYFSSEQWLKGEGLNHSAMHGYNQLGAGTKPILTFNQFNNSGLTKQEWLASLENHYNNPEIQKFKGDLHVINSDGTKGQLIKKNVTPAQAWKETKAWASRKGHPIKCEG